MFVLLQVVRGTGSRRYQISLALLTMEKPLIGPPVSLQSMPSFNDSAEENLLAHILSWDSRL